MKTSTIILLVVALLEAGCSAPRTKYDAAISIAVDQSDVLNQYPRAAQLLLPLGLQDTPEMGLAVTISPITDRDSNPEYTFVLDRDDALTGNSQMRQLVLKAFIQKVQHCLDSLQPKAPLEHSVIFRPVAHLAKKLASISAARRYLVLISDLQEHSEISFYNPDMQYALVHSPLSIQRQLEAQAKPGNLQGIELWLLYRPKSYRDNQPYRIASGLYQQLFSRYGARVHTDQNFNPLP